MLNKAIQWLNTLRDNPPTNSLPVLQFDGDGDTLGCEGSTQSLPNSDDQENSRGACGGYLGSIVLDCSDILIHFLWDVRLIEALFTYTYRHGAISQANKFRACLSVSELNTNNPEEILLESKAARKLGFLRHMLDLYLI